MVEKKMMLAGLMRQSSILHEIISEIEKKQVSENIDLHIYGRRTELVASNLRKLRKIKQSYETQDTV